MTRLLGAIILAFAAVGIARAWDSQPVTVCYQSDGTRIETAYIDGGATAFYPIESSGTVEQTDGGFVAMHRVVFEARAIKFRLPIVMR